MKTLKHLVLVFSLLVAAPATAQTMAVIEGTVVDDSGGALPGVTVEATRPGRGARPAITPRMRPYQTTWRRT